MNVKAFSARAGERKRKIKSDQLPAAMPKPPTLNEATEAQRAAMVEKQCGNMAPGVVQYTTDVLFRDLWLRPDLAPRDHSLVTVSALIAAGQVAHVPYHLNRAMDSGVTRGAGIRSPHPPRFLCRLAERIFDTSGRQRRV